MKDLDKKKFSTKAIHGGESYLREIGHHSAPIFQTSTYSFKSVKDAAAAFQSFANASHSGEELPYIYARLGHPNGKMFEEKIALLESGEAAIGYNSGMAAISGAIFGLLGSGDEIIHSPSLYGGTHGFFYNTCKQFGISAVSVDLNDEKAFKAAINKKTKIVYIETPSNPTLEMFDIAKISKIAKENKLLVAVDNTFMTPVLQRPIELGADIVIHSCTKYIGGHGDVVAGAVISSKEIIEKIRPNTIELGGYIPPFSAWLLMRGLKTLSIRMEKHSEIAMKVAKYLENHPKVEKVYYPGLTNFPQHKLAKKQMSNYGGMISFLIKGGLEAAEKFLNNLELFCLAVSLGATDSLAESPALMTHAFVPKEEREKSGLYDNLVRLSVGLEDADDLIADLEHAFSLC